MLLTEDAQVTLLLTAPLLGGRGESSLDLLTPGEFNRLERALKDSGRELAELLSDGAGEVLDECASVVAPERLQRLLDRGSLVAHACERWQARGIWVVGRGDPDYPRRLQERLAEHAPPILYGCGDVALLDAGGLAVVGSRDVDDGLVAYTEEIGRLAASARCTVVSGGARGIDQAAMRGALDGGGCVAGVLADSLERAALAPEHAEFLTDGRLVLVSFCDPMAGFSVGNAMGRNKFIYTLADAALVVSSDYEKGGTWAGAVEQLRKLRLVPVYVRSTGEPQKGLEGLRKRGALEWPNPATADGMERALYDAPKPAAPAGDCLAQRPR
jgi:predicted Rossmann fold nucleotide-binding protein DprA/Smf involved in DNA uptake